MSFSGVAVAAVAVMVVLQMQDLRQWNAIGPDSGVQYFEPSLARTTSGKSIPADAMMNDEYCLNRHPDIHKDGADGVHRFSAFINEPYLASVSTTREMSMQRDGTVRASRGCHDPVPFSQREVPGGQPCGRSRREISPESIPRDPKRQSTGRYPRGHQ